MKFAFIAKHRGIWPVAWLCEALGVSRSRLPCLAQPAAERTQSAMMKCWLARIGQSFKASDRTYGARRVWHDVLAEGLSLRSASHRAADA